MEPSRAIGAAEFGRHTVLDYFGDQVSTQGEIELQRLFRVSARWRRQQGKALLYALFLVPIPFDQVLP